MSQAVIDVQNLRTHFHTEQGVVKAVEDISFRVDEGRTLGIVGESGSGKSVTSLSIMRLLAGSARIKTGSISLLGKDLVGLPEPQMRGIRGSQVSMIFQEPMTSLNPVFTVMALSCNPKLLIADEPTTALDVTIQAQILDILRRLRDTRGMSILFITHDLGVIAEIADDVIVMFRGKTVEYGPVLDIFENAKHPYTKGLLACRPRLDTPYRLLPTVSDFMETVEEPQADGSVEVRVVETPLTDADIKRMASHGRGRLLHPKSELETLGHAWKDGDFPADTTCVEEGAAPLLTVEDLKVHFPIKRGVFSSSVGHVKAVDGVSFNVYRGQTLGLVGESGCGKTTTGRAILRLVEPTSGAIRFDGVDVQSLRGAALKEMRSRLQIIFQDPYGSLNPRMTVESTIIEPMAVHGLGRRRSDRRDKAASLLEEVGLLPEHLRRYPHEFSGGQRQRICIARALAVEPEFLVCDESVSALDVSVQAQVLNLLKELQEKRGLTYIFISHDLSVVKFMADMMAVMQPVELEEGGEGGRIVEFGPSEAIYADPREEYTRRLISATPDDGVEDIRRRVADREQRRAEREQPT